MLKDMAYKTLKDLIFCHVTPSVFFAQTYHLAVFPIHCVSTTGGLPMIVPPGIFLPSHFYLNLTYFSFSSQIKPSLTSVTGSNPPLIGVLGVDYLGSPCRTD